MLSWLPLLGHDAPVYGAVAGALIAAAHGEQFGVDDAVLNSLELVQEFGKMKEGKVGVPLGGHEGEGL